MVRERLRCTVMRSIVSPGVDGPGLSVRTSLRAMRQDVEGEAWTTLVALIASEEHVGLAGMALPGLAVCRSQSGLTRHSNRERREVITAC